MERKRDEGLEDVRGTRAAVLQGDAVLVPAASLVSRRVRPPAVSSPGPLEELGAKGGMSSSESGELVGSNEQDLASGPDGLQPSKESGDTTVLQVIHGWNAIDWDLGGAGATCPPQGPKDAGLEDSPGTLSDPLGKTRETLSRDVALIRGLHCSDVVLGDMGALFVPETKR